MFHQSCEWPNREKIWWAKSLDWITNGYSHILKWWMENNLPSINKPLIIMYVYGLTEMIEIITTSNTTGYFKNK